MKIATCQFGPVLGAVRANIDRADALISMLQGQELDILVLPEMAFSGYNFPGLESISPFLESTASGMTTLWAKATAQRLRCHVVVGYPEKHEDTTTRRTTNYNSTVTVSPTGEVLLNYRKSFLYYTDQTWAEEGPNGSSRGPGEKHEPFFCRTLGDLGVVGHGICMDINPYKFEAPWTDFEFANTMLVGGARLIVLSTAWITHLSEPEISGAPLTPDMNTISYWIERCFPLIHRDSDDEVIIVFANRCGSEGNCVGAVHVENGEAVETGDRVYYAGSSCVMKLRNGLVSLYERGAKPAILGRGEEGTLLIDTEQPTTFSILLKDESGG